MEHNNNYGMSSKLDKLSKTVEELKHSTHNIDITLAKQNTSLEEHVRRSALLERMVFMAYAAIGALALFLLHK